MAGITLDMDDVGDVTLESPEYFVMGDTVSENQRKRYKGHVRAIGNLGDKIYIGRSEGSTIVVTDPFVSRNHCVIIKRGGSYFLQEVNARNGVAVDDVNISPRQEFQLEHGSLIEIGASRIIMLNPGELAPPEVNLKLVRRITAD